MQHLEIVEIFSIFINETHRKGTLWFAKYSLQKLTTFESPIAFVRKIQK
jgi:hypothetical protein